MRPRLTLTTACAIAFALLASLYALATWHPAAPATPAARGLQVYASEGCIHCHSHFVRPIPADIELWGVTRSEITAQTGNRRQGPDLATVGDRRPADWNRAHLIDPQRFSAGSVMPSFAHLFAPGDTRGDDLVAYLQTLKRIPPAPAPDGRGRNLQTGATAAPSASAP